MPNEAQTEAKEPTTLEEAIAVLPMQQQDLLEALPKHDWHWKPAGIEAGYSESYADRGLAKHLRRDERFCEALALKRAAIEAESGWSAEKWRKKQQEVIDGALKDREFAAANGGLSNMAKHLGYFEQDNRQKGDSGPRIIVNLPAKTEQRRSVPSVVIGALNQESNIPAENAKDSDDNDL